MAKQLQGVYEKVIECAKEEFREKGYRDASLRVIAQKAGTSTGSIYTRFKDKEGVFKVVVEPVVDRLKNWFSNEQEAFCEMNVKEHSQMFEHSNNKGRDFCNLIYDNFDVFDLLVSNSDGTQFSDFIHDIVEIDVKYTVKYIEDMESNILKENMVSLEFIHMLSSAYYSGIFEAVSHNMSREDAIKYVTKMQRFYQCGWRDILEG